MTTLYGIKNCDTVKKARRWLDGEKITYQFHDLRADGLDEKTLRNWTKKTSWEDLLNKRSTTWRQLPDDDKNTINEINAIKQMLINPTLIKRPVLSFNKQIIIGFNASNYQEIFT
jgi:arsenate reductase (glutaredoxin)